MGKPKVLIVEDERMMQLMFFKFLDKYGIAALAAHTIQEAEKLFNENLDVLAIAIDGTLLPDEGIQKTAALAKRFREKFSGPMFAISCDPNSNEELLKNGCDQWVEKMDLWKAVVQLLPTKV